MTDAYCPARHDGAPAHTCLCQMPPTHIGAHHCLCGHEWTGTENGYDRTA